MEISPHVKKFLTPSSVNYYKEAVNGFLKQLQCNIHNCFLFKKEELEGANNWQELDKITNFYLIVQDAFEQFRKTIN